MLLGFGYKHTYLKFFIILTLFKVFKTACFNHFVLKLYEAYISNDSINKTWCGYETEIKQNHTSNLNLKNKLLAKLAILKLKL